MCEKLPLDNYVVAHMLNMRMNEGLTPCEISMAKRQWSRQDILNCALDSFSGMDPMFLALAVNRVWAMLGRIDEKREKLGEKTFYRVVN
jgi:hypothetical protein